MGWNLDKNRPICPQLTEQICVKIAKGELCSNEKLFSVREVALDAGVNPNTVQKAFELLERDGLIYSIRGSGWYVGDSKQKAEYILQTLIKERTLKYIKEMKELGVSERQIMQYIKEQSYESDSQM